jgi:hypothetical protein
VVARDALRPHRPEERVHPGPELLQAHAPTLARRSDAVRDSYAGRMFPGTGSPTVDRILEIGIIVALLISIVLLYRNYRGR